MRAAIKSAKEIELMRAAGRILGRVHKELAAEIVPGMSTLEIDRICEELIRSYGCIPSFLNYQGFPASVCVSLNDEVVHGIPNKNRIVKEGDIISLDTGVIYKGYQSDAARTIGVGTISQQASDLIERTKLSFFAGMKYAKAGCRLFDISRAIGNYAKSYGYGVVRDLVGHGIGRHMHEPPEIPNYPQRFRGMRLMSGMTLAVEPMINIGTWQVRWSDNGWTASTADGSLSAHYENTILITADGPELLSVTEEEAEELAAVYASMHMNHAGRRKAI